MIAKPWYQSKTIWFNVAFFAIGALALLAQLDDFAAYAKYFVLAQALINLALRTVTGDAIQGTAAARPSPISAELEQRWRAQGSVIDEHLKVVREELDRTKPGRDF